MSCSFFSSHSSVLPLLWDWWLVGLPQQQLWPWFYTISKANWTNLLTDMVTVNNFFHPCQLAAVSSCSMQQGSYGQSVSSFSDWWSSDSVLSFLTSIWCPFYFSSIQHSPATIQPTFVSTPQLLQLAQNQYDETGVLLIYLILTIWVQNAGQTGLTEMTPVVRETGRPSLIFVNNTHRSSAPNQSISKRGLCLGSVRPRQETWFTSKYEKTVWKDHYAESMI